MQWHVHGTDAGTGKPVTLAVDHPRALGAVKAAMSKNILVSYVTRPAKLRVLVLPLACAATALLLATSIMLRHQRNTTATQLAAAQSHADQVTASLADSAAVIRTMQQRVASLEQASSGTARDLVDQLEKTRARAAATENSLHEAQERLAVLEQAATSAGAAQAEAAASKKKLAAAQTQVADLRKQLAEQKKQLDEQGKSAALLARSNKKLAEQLDLLKSQLLVQVARSEDPLAAAAPEPAPSNPRRWALITAYDAAADFLSLYFSHDGIISEPVHDGIATTAVFPANAATIRIVHDADKKKVFAATLTVALADDAPKEKIAENTQLARIFATTFAPSFKDADTWIPAAVRQLNGKDASDRLVKIGPDYKLTVSNNRAGSYSWKIESPRGDLD